MRSPQQQVFQKNQYRMAVKRTQIEGGGKGGVPDTAPHQGGDAKWEIRRRGSRLFPNDTQGEARAGVGLFLN